MIGRNSEARLSPFAQGRHLPRHTNEAKIQFAAANRCLARIAFRQKLKNDPVAEVRRQRQMRLQRNAFFFTSWKQATESGDRRVATIGGNQHSCLESLLASHDRPVSVTI